MSSHHVIRDNQEAAVFLYDHTSCDSEILGSALEWSPLIITTENSAEFLLRSGIKIDVVLIKSIGIETNSAYEYTTHNIEDSYLGSGLRLLTDKNHKAVYIFGSLDSLDLEVIESSGLVISIIDRKRKWSFIKKGKINKWLPDGAKLYIKSTAKIASEGVYQSVDVPNLIKIDKEGLVKLKSDQGFWLGEDIS
ncbi:hypothetical protein E1176_04195 [Fulvivirga sp. RKSG066]|uniref:hypothetical protein n=1 Tax=Fulvivirga aurantia TaxID=2529383 RepID=UPI0012BD709A|nr:hypothetical protein [Fulvivirga aurantia]MTI20212.1 hypothetical protein [Fulvivirga aurantia]